MSGTLYKARFPALPQSGARALAEALEGSGAPAQAVALDLADEAGQLWTVEAYFAARPAAATLEAACAASGTAVFYMVEKVIGRDWLAAGLETLAPVRAGRITLHGAHDRTRFAHRRFAIEIDAGLAFGTGHHGSTRGALIALDGALRRRRPRRVLDVGTGSGVLAIAATRLAQASVIATDLDREAVRVAAANARLNRAGARVRCRAAPGTAHPLLRPPRRYDLILANILARPLMELAGPLAAILAPGGSIVLSGMTEGQDRRVAALYRTRGLALDRRLLVDGWVTVVLRRPPRRQTGRRVPRTTSRMSPRRMPMSPSRRSSSAESSLSAARRSRRRR